jgi:hypothetical protein
MHLSVSSVPETGNWRYDTLGNRVPIRHAVNTSTGARLVQVRSVYGSSLLVTATSLLLLAGDAASKVY